MNTKDLQKKIAAQENKIEELTTDREALLDAAAEGATDEKALRASGVDLASAQAILERLRRKLTEAQAKDAAAEREKAVADLVAMAKPTTREAAAAFAEALSALSAYEAAESRLRALRAPIMAAARRIPGGPDGITKLCDLWEWNIELTFEGGSIEDLRARISRLQAAATAFDPKALRVNLETAVARELDRPAREARERAEREESIARASAPNSDFVRVDYTEEARRARFAEAEANLRAAGQPHATWIYRWDEHLFEGVNRANKSALQSAEDAENARLRAAWEARLAQDITAIWEAFACGDENPPVFDSFKIESTPHPGHHLGESAPAPAGLAV